MDKKLTNRIERIIGQLRSVSSELKKDASCDTVIIQLLAIRGGIESLLRTYIDQQLDQCNAADTEKTRKLLHTLLKEL